MNTRPFSHGSDSSKYMYYLTIWTKKAVLPRKWLKWVHVLSYNMNKKGRSHTEVTQVSTCAILQYEQKRPFSHGSDSSEYMCYLTIWTKKAVLPLKWLKWVHVLSYNMNKKGRSPTEVTQVSTCTILQYEHQAVLPRKWLKWVHVLSYNMNTRPFSHGSDSSKYMYYLTIWTPGRSPTEVTQVSTCTILQYEHQAVLPRKWLK